MVGASYVALECAGFLRGVGLDTTVMMRSIPLRGFDQQMAGQVKTYMEEHGTKFIEGAVPASVEKLESGRKKVTWTLKDGSTASDEFDTVMFAVGRDAGTSGMGLEAAGVEVNANKKVTTKNEQTNVPHIYAVGDVIDGAKLDPPSETTELTPVAIQAGKLLAARLYGEGTATMDYALVPPTVYTPLEYGACGLAEEVAVAQYGEKNVEVFHSYYKPLEWTAPRPGSRSGPGSRHSAPSAP